MVLDVQKPMLDPQFIGDFLIGHSIGGIRGDTFKPYAITVDTQPITKTQLSTLEETAPITASMALALSRDRPMLKKILKPAASSDDFTARLIATMDTASHDERVEMDIFRSDFMLDAGKNGNEASLKQVELNTIAAGLACLSDRATYLHTYINPDKQYVHRHSNESVPRLMVQAAKARASVDKPLVLFVVQPNETNRCDQRAHEFGIHRNGGETVRLTLSQIAEQGTLNEAGDLVVNGRAVDLVYFRAGYGPGDYPTDVEWGARATIERSSAVKIPTVPMQLVGAKSVQQALCDPALLSRYLAPSEVEAMSSLFAPMHALPRVPSAAIKEAMARPEEWVLKPQREGGGHNYFNEDVRRELERMYASDDNEKDQWVLMKRIVPTPQSRRFFKDGEVHTDDLVAEIGLFISILTVDGEVAHNGLDGVLVRSKSAAVNEGGVMTGVAIFDSLHIE